MDPHLLRYYNQELQHLREMGGEFAKAFPKVAGRLGMEELECADPYVERLLEGFAFLSARVRLKIDAEFPRFTQHLLEMVYPHYLSPVPSMTVVQMRPDLTEGTLSSGFSVPRGTVLRSRLGKGDQTACEYRTAHEVTLWPLEIVEAQYAPYSGEPSVAELSDAKIKATLRLRLRVTAGLTFDQLKLDRLVLFLRGSGELPLQLYERLLANAIGFVAMPPGRPPPWTQFFGRQCIQRVGFDEDQALLPHTPRTFSGYRQLQEYFAFPERFLFVELCGLESALQRCGDDELDILIFLDRSDPTLGQVVDASRFELFCTPAINLFPKRADRIHLSERHSEFHVIPDRARPMDYEVYCINQVEGYGTSAEHMQEFLPFYAANDLMPVEEAGAYYAVHRTPRMASPRQRQRGARSSYLGSEVFVSLVDAGAMPYRTQLRQLGVETLCTNRDLPLFMPVGQGKDDFSLDISAPVETVRCIAGPTRPRPSFVEGETAWRLISHLSLNYLSLADSSKREGAAALRELLMLYADASQPALLKQIEGVRSVSASPITRRIPLPGPITVGRGLQVTLTLDESAFEGSGEFLLGAVLEQFFAKYVSINSFTETVVQSVDNREIMRWPVRLGLRHIL